MPVTRLPFGTSGLAWQCGLDQFHRSLRVGEFDNQFVVPFVLQFNHDHVLRIVNIPENPLAVLIKPKARQFDLSDKNCPLAYDPSGEDFLSPCLGEADLMRRVLASQEFARWLRTFMPPTFHVGQP
jgi:Protein of unknown function (DUF2891)